MENEKLEYKLDIVKKDGVFSFLKEVVAFLNTSGGEIIFGVDDNGTYIGFSSEEYDKKMEQIQNAIFQSISPNVQSLIDVRQDKNNCIKVIVSNVSKNKPYYIKKYGRSTKGVYIRRGFSSVPLEDTEIEKMYKSHNKVSLSSLEASHNKYEFNKLSIRFEVEIGHKLTDIKKLNLGILNEQEKVTKLGELFADENSNVIDIAVFEGINKTANFHIESFGNIPLNESFEKILNYIELNNKIIVKDILSAARVEQKSYNSKCIREAVLNAFIHNDYELGFPKFYLYEDRLEISSFGGLLPSMSLEAFFEGRSKVRNQGIVNIFKLFKETESVGRGVPIILEEYSKSIFRILDDELIVTFPNRNYIEIANDEQKIANDEQKIVNDEQKIANDEQKIINDEQKITNDEQKITNDEQKITNDEQNMNKQNIKNKNLEKILKEINKKGRVTSNEISTKYQLSKRISQSYLKELYDNSKIDRKKEGKSFIYLKKN